MPSGIAAVFLINYEKYKSLIMRKLSFLFAVALIVVKVSAFTPEVYVQAEQLPRLLYILPAPPAFDSLRGWLIGLVLAQVAPERAEAIYARSWDYCNSRVIVGAHWQSDVDNSRTAASVGFGVLQNSNRYRAQLIKAQLEYQSKK